MYQMKLIQRNNIVYESYLDVDGKIYIKKISVNGIEKSTIQAESLQVTNNVHLNYHNC